MNGHMFYFPVNAPPEIIGVLARALLHSPDRRLALLPEGEARITLAETSELRFADGTTERVKAYRIDGLDFGPVWVLVESRPPHGCAPDRLDVHGRRAIRAGPRSIASGAKPTRESLVLTGGS